MSDLLEKDTPVRTSDIATAMRATYCQPEWSLFFEVANGTGANVRRHADAVAMNMYPSRGLVLHGFEFKASRGDWKRELADPQKAEEIAQYCDYWSVVTGPDIVAPGELPATWGHIECKNGKLRTKVQPTKNDSMKSLNRHFLAALLRCQSKQDEAVIKNEIRKGLELARAGDQDRINREIDQRAEKAMKLTARYQPIAEAMKDTRFRYASEEDFVRAISMALELNIDGEWSGLRAIKKSLGDLHGKVTAALEKISSTQKEAEPTL